MRQSDNSELVVKHFEGLGDGDKKTPQLEAYICPAGVGTLGFGHALYHPVTGAQLRVKTFGLSETIRLSNLAVAKRYGRPWITVTEAEALLDEDMAKYSGGVSKLVGKASTNQNEFDALVSLAFNIGLANFGTSTVLKRHLAGNKLIDTRPMTALVPLSRTGATGTTQTQAFCAWSKSDGSWLPGLFKRRWVESELYFGHDVKKSLLIADAFKS